MAISLEQSYPAKRETKQPYEPKFLKLRTPSPQTIIKSKPTQKQNIHYRLNISKVVIVCLYTEKGTARLPTL